mgnify:FL=1|jgi:hypothetical protein
MVKYHFERDDGAGLDVQGGVWESVLELAYLNGWVPAGTDEPRDGTWRRKLSGTVTAPMLGQRQWRSGDYFSGVGQYVRPDDAHALATAVMRALPGTPKPKPEVRERPRPEHSVAEFARGGGFVIAKHPGSID